MNDLTAISPPALAKALGVDPGKIISFIKDGTLKAINLSHGSRKPRYRILLTEVERFLNSRSTAPTTPKAKRRRRVSNSVKKYF
jgi:helix-turn-helix protein